MEKDPQISDIFLQSRTFFPLFVIVVINRHGSPDKTYTDQMKEKEGRVREIVHSVSLAI